MTDDKLKAGEVDSRPMQRSTAGQYRPRFPPHGIEAGRPLSTIPDWIVQYDKKNFQSSAGKAIRILINHTKSLQAENERLNKEYAEAIELIAEGRRLVKTHYSTIQALQSKIDRVIEYCKAEATSEKYPWAWPKEILDLLK